MKSCSRSINTYTSIVTEKWVQCRLTANININFTNPASVPTQASTNKCIDRILTRTSVNAGRRFTFLRREIIIHWLHGFKTHYLFIHINKCKRLNLQIRKSVGLFLLADKQKSLIWGNFLHRDLLITTHTQSWHYTYSY